MTQTLDQVDQVEFVVPSDPPPSRLPTTLLAAITEITEQVEAFNLADEDGNLLADLSQLEQAASKFQRVMFDHDTVRFRKIEIGQGRTKLKLPWDDLGLSKQAIDKLQKADASQTAISMFKEIREAGNELKKLRKDIQDLYMTREGDNWTIVAAHYGEVCVKLAELIEACNRLRRHIIAIYPESRHRFAVGLAELFYEIGGRSITEIAADVERHMQKFPTLQAVNSDFRIKITQPEFVPSLKRQLEGDVNMASLIAEISTANRTTEEQAAIARIQRLHEQAELEGKAQAVAYYEQKTLKRIAEVLNSAKDQIRQNKLEPGDLGQRNSDMLKRAMNELRIMTSTPWGAAVADAVETFADIERLANSEDVSKSQLQQEIDDLLGFIGTEYSFEFAPPDRSMRAINRRRTKAEQAALAANTDFDDEIEE